jgi:hypothetical protein
VMAVPARATLIERSRAAKYPGQDF